MYFSSSSMSIEINSNQAGDRSRFVCILYPITFVTPFEKRDWQQRYQGGIHVGLCRTFVREEWVLPQRSIGVVVLVEPDD